MDHIDRKILYLLQENARIPIKEIASAVYLSSPAVSARIEKLEKEGVIKRYEATLDMIKLGYHIKAYINLEVAPERKAEFSAFIRKIPFVLECDCVTGGYSMLMKAAFHSTMELDQFIGRLQEFGHTNTQIVFSSCVERRGLPLSEQEKI